MVAGNNSISGVSEKAFMILTATGPVISGELSGSWIIFTCFTGNSRI